MGQELLLSRTSKPRASSQKPSKGHGQDRPFISCKYHVYVTTKVSCQHLLIIVCECVRRHLAPERLGQPSKGSPGRNRVVNGNVCMHVDDLIFEWHRRLFCCLSQESSRSPFRSARWTRMMSCSAGRGL